MSAENQDMAQGALLPEVGSGSEEREQSQPDEQAMSEMGSSVTPIEGALEASVASADEMAPAWDIDAEWAEMRAKAGLPPHAEYYEGDRFVPPLEANLAPVVLLYTGFFLGPLVTFVVALLVLVSKPSLRQFTIMGAVAALTWLLVQGLSWAIGTSLTPNLLQVVRSSLNLLAGVFYLLYIHHITPGRLVVTRQSIAQSVGAFVLVAVLYLGLSANFLVWLGR